MQPLSPAPTPTRRSLAARPPLAHVDTHAPAQRMRTSRHMPEGLHFPEALAGGGGWSVRWLDSKGREGRRGGLSAYCRLSAGSSHGLAREENNQHY